MTFLINICLHNIFRVLSNEEPMLSKTMLEKIRNTVLNSINFYNKIEKVFDSKNYKTIILIVKINMNLNKTCHNKPFLYECL